MALEQLGGESSKLDLDLSDLVVTDELGPDQLPEYTPVAEGIGVIGVQEATLGGFGSYVDNKRFTWRPRG